MKRSADFTIGYDVGFVGRWFRLIVGVYFSVLAVAAPLLGEPVPRGDALGFLGSVGLYFAAILAAYVLAFFVLRERILGRSNPWVGTLLLLGPLVIVTAFQIGPVPFRVAIGLYYSVASVFNFAMSYGGCEVVAIPSLIFRRRYTLYCPYNAVDVVESALRVSTRGQRVFAVASMAIAVVVGGYFLLVEEFGMLRDLGLRLDVHNAWALLLLVPVAFLAWNAAGAYQAAGKTPTAEVRRLGLGALVLLVLTVMFVLGATAQPLFGLAMLIGGLAALVEWLRGRSKQEDLDPALGAR